MFAYPPEPEPVPGCDVCKALAAQREDARSKGDVSKAVDCNVEIRHHPHPEGRKLPYGIRR